MTRGFLASLSRAAVKSRLLLLPSLLCIWGCSDDADLRDKTADEIEKGPGFAYLDRKAKSYYTECFGRPPTYDPLPEFPTDDSPETNEAAACLHAKWSKFADSVLVNWEYPLAAKLLSHYLDNSGDTVDLSWQSGADGETAWSGILSELETAPIGKWYAALAKQFLASRAGAEGKTEGTWDESWCDDSLFPLCETGFENNCIYGTESHCRISTKYNPAAHYAFGTLHLTPGPKGWVEITRDPASGQLGAEVFLTFCMDETYLWDKDRKLYHRELWWLEQRGLARRFAETGCSDPAGVHYTATVAPSATDLTNPDSWVLSAGELSRSQ